MFVHIYSKTRGWQTNIKYDIGQKDTREHINFDTRNKN